MAKNKKVEVEINKEVEKMVEINKEVENKDINTGKSPVKNSTVNVVLLLKDAYPNEATAKGQATRIFGGACRDNRYIADIKDVKIALMALTAKKGESKGKTFATECLKTFDKNIDKWQGEVEIIEKDSTSQFSWGKRYKQLSSLIGAGDIAGLKDLADVIVKEIELKKKNK